jgi:hypothetical protein
MNRAKSIHMAVLVSLVFVGSMVVISLTALAQEPREPLVKAEVIRLLENGVSPDRVGALAKQYGVAFQVNEDAEKQLREAGATDDLIGMLRALAPRAAPPAPSHAIQPPAEAPAKPAPATGPKTFLLKEGSEVKLKFAQDLSSKTATEGDKVNFTLDQDVTVDGVVVIRSGSPAVGEVSHAERAGHMGKAGQLSVRIDYVKAGDARLRLRGTKGREGEGKTGTAVALTVLFGPIGLLKHGKEVKVQEGAPLTAYVDQDMSLPAAP